MAEPIDGPYTPTAGGKHRRSKPKLLGADGLPLSGDPRILLPDAPMPAQPSSLHLTATEQGIGVIIGGPMMSVRNGTPYGETIVPWDQVQGFVVGLIGLIARSFPRPAEDAEESPTPE